MLTHVVHTVTYLLTPWGRVFLEKLTGFTASQEIPRILCNSKVHYRVQKCPPPVPILSQLDPVHTRTFHFQTIHLNIILPSTPGSPKWSFSFRFPHQKPVYATPPTQSRYIPRPFHSSRFYHPNKSLSSSLCSFLHYAVSSSLLSPNILLYTLFPNTLSLRSSLSVSDQV